jgi:hypothetical protein
MKGVGATLAHEIKNPHQIDLFAGEWLHRQNKAS